MNESYLMKEQELIKLNQKLDQKNKALQSQLLKKQKNECSLKRTENEKKKSVCVTTNGTSNNKLASNKENFTNNDKKSQQELSKCYVEDASTINNFIEQEFPENIHPIPNQIKPPPPPAAPPTKPIIKQNSTNTRTTNIQKIGENVIPDKLAKRNISTEGLIKFLKSKVVILENELAKIQKDNTKKLDDLKLCTELQKQLELQRDQAVTKCNYLEAKITKFDEKNTEFEKLLKERDRETICLKTELDVAKRELKNQTQTNASLERRLLKTQEDLEAARLNCKNIQETERESRENMRKERENFEKQIKILRKQRLDLLNAYKKQLMLIDNLKRQNLCLEQVKLIDFAEKDFIKILDWHRDESP